MEKKRATTIGFAAIILWSTMVGLIRGVSEGLGAVGGAAMIYSLSGLLLIFTVGFPNLRQIPRRYLLAGSVLFVSYEICLALSLGYAASRQQAIEVGMVNYLWPSLTILFAILFNGQKSGWLVIPGLILALLGVGWVLGGEHGLQPDEIISNVISSPLSYLLAFVGAFIWAAYCTVTAKYARGKNAITLFVLLTALTLWLKFLASDQPPMLFSWPVVIADDGLRGAGAGLRGVERWHPARQRQPAGGGLLLHAGALLCAGGDPAECDPVVVLLAGAGMVCLGSLLCWYATRR